jgi:hypothetical protein
MLLRLLGGRDSLALVSRNTFELLASSRFAFLLP